MTTRDVGWPLALAFFTASCAASGVSPAATPAAPVHAQAQAVNRDALIQHEFVKRVQAYIDLRKAEERKLPNLPDRAEPEQITGRQKALQRALQRARHGAKPGDIFQERTRPVIRRLIAGAISTQGAAPKQAIQDENPGGRIRIAVNEPYPTSVPLTTVPPQVLLALPRLPDEEMEYRFAGRRLILLDARANMVVDYMERALP